MKKALKAKKRKTIHYVYILSCSDKTLYTGYTKDIEKRLRVHNTSKAGAKYTKIRRPVSLEYVEEYKTLSEALRREYAIKQLERSEKFELIKLGKQGK